jgi:hypothetical protein
MGWRRLAVASQCGAVHSVGAAISVITCGPAIPAPAVRSQPRDPQADAARARPHTEPQRERPLPGAPPSVQVGATVHVAPT